MDGVIYHGNQILPGVPEFIQWLHDEKKEYLFLTNNSGYTPRELNQKLARMGLDVPEEHFYTSALATAAFLKEQAAGCSAFVIGEAGLLNALYDVGITMNDVNPDYVVVGEGRSYSLDTLTKATNLIELLKGEKDLNTLAVENNIQPNLLRNWKKEFLDNASAVFDDKREDNLKEKLAEERKEKAEFAKKVGQLTMQVDWLKKNLKKFVDLTTRVSLVQNLLTTKEIPASVGAKLLDINRTSIYYEGSNVSDEELACKEIIDHLHTDNPAWGARQMSAQLKAIGYHVGRRKARRYMNEMDIYPIYPKMNLSKRMQQAKVCPYLLRNATIDKPNQAWSIDITYIPIKRGFLYLSAVIDWHSRCIVGWEVNDTLDTRMVINALKKAFQVAKPQILNSDQGCQFTSQQYIDFVKENGIRQSMDGKSRWADNIMIERWFRSFKYEEAYLTQYKTGFEGHL